jgi:hypothetical protein
MAPIREYSPQIRNHSAPKNQWNGAAPFQSRSHSHAPFHSLCNQTKNRTAPFQITKHRIERLRSYNQEWNDSVLLDSSTKHYLGETDAVLWRHGFLVLLSEHCDRSVLFNKFPPSGGDGLALAHPSLICFCIFLCRCVTATVPPMTHLLPFVLGYIPY